jgi:predicted phosphate transport protein (TIGR00153 family)
MSTDTILPKRDFFFGIVTSHTDRVVAAAQAAQRLIGEMGKPDQDLAGLVEEVCTNETSADDIKQHLIKVLFEAFVTPIDRDQVHTLVLDLDRVADGLKHLALGIEMYHVTMSTPAARELAALAVEVAMRLNRGVIALNSKERATEVPRLCQEIEALEEKGAEVMEKAITGLFASEGDEAAAWNALKMRNLYAQQEKVLDSAKRAAHTIEEILLENA